MSQKEKILTEEEIAQKLAEQIALEEMAESTCLIKVVAGSHAYGTNIEGSDWDERGIFADDIKRIILPFNKIEQVKFREDDKVYYELSKYMSLLLVQNPNVIELIWTDESDILFKSDLGQILIDNRQEFLSKHAKDSYVGYALKQLKRIKGHNKWINNPQPEAEPEQKDFCSVVYNFSGVSNFNKKVPFEGYTAVSLGDNNFSLWKNEKIGIDPKKSWMDKRGNPNPMLKSKLSEFNSEHLAPDLIVKVNFTLFDSHHENWKMYWQWKTNRNEKRSELEEKYGYDVKHAMHLIRLLRSGIDILEHGCVPVKRADREHLLDIRSGKYTYEEIVKESEMLSEKVTLLHTKTKLPDTPNYELAKEIMLHIYKETWKLENKEVNKLKLF